MGVSAYFAADTSGSGCGSESGGRVMDTFNRIRYNKLRKKEKV